MKKTETLLQLGHGFRGHEKTIFNKFYSIIFYLSLLYHSSDQWFLPGVLF